MIRCCAIPLRPFFLVATLIAAARTAPADLRIEEAASGEAAGHRVVSRRVTSIRGKTMRVEVTEAESHVVTIYNLETLSRTTLYPLRREMESKSFRELQATAERKSTKDGVRSSISPTGAHMSAAGAACDEFRYSIRVPVTKSDGPVLIVSGNACLTSEGADEYRQFALNALRQDILLGLTSDNIVMVALARAQTEQYRLFAGAAGMPLITHSEFRFEGGMLAGMLNKAGAGTRDSRVEKIATQPLPVDEFASPPGWKAVRK